MLKMDNETFSENKVVNSHNFLLNSDFFYAANFPDEELKNLNLDNYTNIMGANGSTLLKAKSFQIKENSIIFCHTMFVSSLFKHLRKIKEFKNIKLVTHQTDIPINEELFSTKPDCISTWFSTNVIHEDEKLIPIPIGIGNSHNQKTLTLKNFYKIKDKTIQKDSVYANFNINTNYFHRYDAYKSIISQDWAVLDKPNLPLDKFLIKIQQNKFCLAPWGNGYDTHRLWEAIYAGVIPITRDHLAFKSFKDLPIIFLDSYRKIKIEQISNLSFNNLNMEKLKMDWWVNKLNENSIGSNSKVLDFYETDEESRNNITDFYKIYHKENKVKRKNTFKRKVHKKLIGRKINKLVGV